VRRGLLLLAVVAVPGCSVTAPVPLIEIAAPERWLAAELSASAPVQPAPTTREWWRHFGDPALEALISAADDGNLDLQRARARVLEARAARKAGAAALRPEVAVNGTAARSNARRLGFDNPVSYFETAFDAAWEIDVFGATAHRVEAADRLAQSADAGAADVRLSLRAEVARNYIELRAAQQRLRLAQAMLDSRRESAALVAALQKTGLRSELDLAQAEAPALALQAAVPSLQTAIVAAARRLDTLLGQPPGAVAAQLASPAVLPVADAAPLLDEPAAVIARRPDLRRAERELAASGSLAAAATADFYPRLTLGSLAGYRDIASGPAGLIWTLAAGLAAPVYNSGRLEAQSSAAGARLQQRELAYRQAVLSALEEVEVALAGYFNARRHVAALDLQIETERRRLMLAGERFRRGISSFSDVLEAQRALYAAETERVDAVSTQSRAYIAVNKAMGG
jgi:NodT family efflux transporter outer membrane factor (OMF) lipoprotein